MKKIRIYLLVALLCGMSSCSDFLDRYPDTAVPEEESMTDLVFIVVLRIPLCIAEL